MTAVLGPPTGIPRFVGDRANRMLRFFAEDPNRGGAGFLETATRWPLVLYGPSGTGKTSLAMAIISQWGDHHAGGDPVSPEGSRAVFLSAPDFGRRYRQAAATGSLSDLRHRLAQANGLVIDDLQLIASKPDVQNEVVFLLDQFETENRPLVITMNAAPHENQQLSPQLVSRLCAGLMLQVHPPGPDARREIVIELAAAHQVQLTEDAIDLMVERLDATVPRVALAFKQLTLALSASPELNSTAAIDAATLTQLFRMEPQDIESAAHRIIQLVASEYHVKPAELKGPTRKQSIVLARGIAIYLNRVLLKASFLKIGSWFGNRDHSTILHAYRKIELLAAGDNPAEASDRAIISRLLARLTEQLAGQIRFD